MLNRDGLVVFAKRACPACKRKFLMTFTEENGRKFHTAWSDSMWELAKECCGEWGERLRELALGAMTRLLTHQAATKCTERAIQTALRLLALTAIFGLIAMVVVNLARKEAPIRVTPEVAGVFAIGAIILMTAHGSVDVTIEAIKRGAAD